MNIPNLPKIKSKQDEAVSTVVSVLNIAKQKVGIRQTLKQLASSRQEFTAECKVSLQSLGDPLNNSPLTKSCEKFLAETIERKWRLTPTLQYLLRYMGSSQDECTHYYYYEALFSQPTAAYPVPQANASVFFRVEDKHLETPEIKGVPMIKFRIEGHHTDHDVRYVLLTEDWILAVIKMKINLFKRVEAIRLF